MVDDVGSWQNSDIVLLLIVLNFPANTEIPRNSTFTTAYSIFYLLAHGLSGNTSHQITSSTLIWFWVGWRVSLYLSLLH